eukprot:108255_1
MATKPKTPKTPKTPKRKGVKFADDGKKTVKTRGRRENGKKKIGNRRSKTMQPRPRSKTSADDMSVKSKKKNDTKYGRSKSKTRLKRPKTTKATGQIVTFFSATEQKTSSPFPSITQSSSDIDFTYGATEISKDKMTASNLKKYMSMLDDSSIKTRKKIGDSFKLFRQALNEQEKLLCNNLAKVHKRKKQWINNHLEYIATNETKSFIELNPLIELELDNQSIKHQISLFGSVNLMMANDNTILTETKTDTNENINGEKMSISMKQKLELSKLQNATMEKLDQIIRMEQEARSKSQEAIRLQIEAEEDMRIMAIRTKEVEQQLLIAKPELDKAMAAVSSIEKSALDEIKVLKKPPKIVEMAMTAVALMLGHIIKNWRDVQKILSYKFIPSVLNYDTEKLLNQNVKNRDKVRKIYLSKDDFTFERVNKGSKVCGSLVVWVRSQIRYSEMLDVVIPMRKEIRKLKKESKRKTKLAKQLLIAVSKLKQNIQNYQKECSGIINHIIDKTDEELKSFGHKLEPLNAKFYSILNEIDC